MHVLKALPGRCEEASPLSHDVYIPCNAPAVRMVFSPSDNREYRMCEPCAWHNTMRRGMQDRGLMVAAPVVAEEGARA